MSQEGVNMKRRDLIRTSATAAGTALATATAMNFFTPKGRPPKRRQVGHIPTPPYEGSGRVILFQGDSVTNAGAKFDTGVTNTARSLGRGFVLLIAGELIVHPALHDVQVYNRGVNGNKVRDLQQRWQKDCLDLRPDLLNIMIGVNDVWHTLDGRDPTTMQEYGKRFRDLLMETREKLPNTQIIICEPFFMRFGFVRASWLPECERWREVAVQIATDLDLTVVPFQQMFNAAMSDGKTTPKHWTIDGVHPTLAGHALMAKTWQKIVVPSFIESETV